MSGSNSNAKWVNVLLIQKAVSLFFAALALAFPFYILYRHGLSVLPVYDRFGNVIGHANYFVLSLAMSAFTLVISWLSYVAARKALRQIRGSK
jgi:hypothetical protein